MFKFKLYFSLTITSLILISLSSLSCDIGMCKGWLVANCQTKDVGTPVAISTEPSKGSNPSASSSSSQPPRPATVATETGIQLLDIDGNVEVTQDAKGYVYIPSKNAPIGITCGLVT